MKQLPQDYKYCSKASKVSYQAAGGNYLQYILLHTLLNPEKDAGTWAGAISASAIRTRYIISSLAKMYLQGSGLPPEDAILPIKA